MIVKLLTEHHLEFLSLKGGCRGSSESTLVKIPYCWKSHATAHICSVNVRYWPNTERDRGYVCENSKHYQGYSDTKSSEVG